MVQQSAEVSGDCPPRFEAVRAALRGVVDDDHEVGAAFAVTIDGEMVIDLWVGHMDAERARPWERDTIVNLYSVGKAITAICLLQQVEAGVVDLAAPVARYWPEFASAGKSALPVRFLLTHEAGLPAVAKELAAGTALDWDAMCGALAEQAPWWTPGVAHGYHINTYGFLVGEVLRRVSGMSVGQYFRCHIAEPGEIDFLFGFGAEHDHRVADVLPSVARVDAATPPPEMQRKAGANPPELSGQGIVNSRSWRAAEVPATNGHGNARSLARLYGALAGTGSVESVHILSPDTIAMATAEQVYGRDEMLGRVTRFGLGFQLAMAERPLGPNPGAFGHFGAGGSLGFADPAARIGLGYAMNQGRAGWQHRHVRNLIDLVYAAL